MKPFISSMLNLPAFCQWMLALKICQQSKNQRATESSSLEKPINIIESNHQPDPNNSALHLFRCYWSMNTYSKWYNSLAMPIFFERADGRAFPTAGKPPSLIPWPADQLSLAPWPSVRYSRNGTTRLTARGLTHHHHHSFVVLWNPVLLSLSWEVTANQNATAKLWFSQAMHIPRSTPSSMNISLLCIHGPTQLLFSSFCFATSLIWQFALSLLKLWVIVFQGNVPFPIILHQTWLH